MNYFKYNYIIKVLKLREKIQIYLKKNTSNLIVFINNQSEDNFCRLHWKNQ